MPPNTSDTTGKALSAALTSKFKTLDTAGNGQISARALAEVLAALGVPSEQVSLLLRLSGSSSEEGQVEYSKFLDWVCCVPKVNDEGATEAIIDPPLVPEAAYSEQQLDEWKSKYTDIHSIYEALESGDTVLIKGSWLVQWARSGGTLPKRQDLPPEAIWEVGEHKDSLSENRRRANYMRDGEIIAALSYCWATPAHPDPKGEQLRRVARTVELLLTRAEEVGLFIDWCSIYQAPRTEEQQESFKRALRNVNLWYAHELVFSLLLTLVPDGVKPYMERGWPSFEYAISGLIKSDGMFLDLAGIPWEGPADFKDWDDFASKVLFPCRISRPAPVTPATFRAKLDALHFTNGADRAFVMKKYLSTFQEVMASAESFELTRLAWNAEHGKDLASSLPWCSSLEAMDVTYSAISMEGVRHIAEALHRCPTLTTLDLQGCDVGDEGVEHLLRVLPETGLKKLFFAENGITDVSAGRLAEVLRGPGAQLCEISLRGNKVTDAGAASLAAAIREKGCPLELLRLAENTAVGDAGVELLAEAARESRTFRHLDLRKITIGTAAQKCLDAVVAERHGFKVQQ